MKNKLTNTLLLFSTLLCSCGSSNRLSLLVPSGAPLLSVAGVLNTLEYEVTMGSDLLPVAFSKGEKDLIIAPITLGAKLYNAKVSDYQLGAMLGWGNLHILSRDPLESISDLTGQSLLAFAEHTTPGIMLRLATQDIEVEITYFKAVTDVSGAFLNKQFDYVLVSEPILSQIKANSVEELFVYSLQNVSHLPKIAQFGLFVHPNIDERKITTFLEALEANIAQLNVDSEGYATSILAYDPQFKALGVEVMTEVIPKMDLAFKSGQAAKQEVDSFLNYLVSIDPSLIGAHGVHETFYRN